MDEKAQSTLSDSIVFLAITLVVSATIFGYSSQIFNVEAVVEGEDSFRYAVESFDALLQSTIDETSYRDISGERVHRVDWMVVDLLLDELRLLSEGVPSSHFRGAGEYNQAIVGGATKLIDTARFGFALFASYGEVGILLSSPHILSRSSLPAERYADSRTVSMKAVGLGGEAVLDFYLWRV